MQARLFGAASGPAFDRQFRRARRVALSATAWYEHAPGWMSGDDVLFDQLAATIRWTESERVMYEKLVGVPRLTARLPADGDPPAVLTDALAAMSERYDRPVETLSLAWYRDGRDSVAWHGDRMGDQVADCIVAIVSLRGPRRLRLRPDGGGAEVAAFDLGFGDLLVMGGSCQRDFEHAVPKVASAPPRMSVMFRTRSTA